MTDADVSAFLRQELDSSRLLECADHLAECEICRGKLASQKDLAAAQSQIEAELRPFVDHIPEGDLQNYVSGRLDLTRVRDIDRHLAKCTQCVKEVRDLRDFAAEMPPVHRNFAAEMRPERTFFLRRRFLAIAAFVSIVVAIAFISLRRPREVLVVNDASGPVRIDQRGELHGIGLLAADQEQAVRQAVTEQKLSLPVSVRELRGESSVLMGAAEQISFHLESPVGTVVRSTRPTLSWTSDPKSVGYRVTLRDEGTGQTTTSTLMDLTSWTVSPDLERGHSYDWQVISSRKKDSEVLAPQPPGPPAKFMVLDGVTNSTLEQLPRSHLLRAVLYVNAGLLDDANHELTELQRSNPQSQLVRNLIDQLQRARGIQ